VKRKKKKTFEFIADIVLTTDEWTPENSMLTSAMKINRAKVVETFKSDIDKLYEKIKN